VARTVQHTEIDRSPPNKNLHCTLQKKIAETVILSGNNGEILISVLSSQSEKKAKMNPWKRTL